jgi:hypothetical protein
MRIQEPPAVGAQAERAVAVHRPQRDRQRPAAKDIVRQSRSVRLQKIGQLAPFVDGLPYDSLPQRRIDLELLLRTDLLHDLTELPMMDVLIGIVRLSLRSERSTLFGGRYRLRSEKPGLSKRKR